MPEKCEKSDPFWQSELPTMLSRSFVMQEHMTNSEKNQWMKNETDFNRVQEVIEQSDAVRRLSDVKHLGNSWVPHPEYNFLKTLQPEYNRYLHSNMLALLVKAISAKLGNSAKEMMPLFISAWTHDIGHYTFPHWYDVVFEGDHEQDSVKKLEEDAGLNELLSNGSVFRKNSLFPKRATLRDEVIDLILKRGKSPLKEAQSAIDTLAYLVVDSGVVARGPEGKGYYAKDQGMRVINSIVGIHKEELGILQGEFVLEVNNIEVWQEMLNYRAEMMRDVYFAEKNFIAEGALQKFIKVALEGPEALGGEERNSFLHELRNGTNASLHKKLFSLVEAPEAPFAKYRNLLHMANWQFNPESPVGPKFKIEKYDTEQEANKAIEGQESAFIVKPYDYTKKKFTVYYNGQLVTLQANNIKFGPEDKKFIAVLPK